MIYVTCPLKGGKKVGLREGDTVDFVHPPDNLVLQPPPMLRELIKQGRKTMAVVEYQMRKNPEISDVVETRTLTCGSQDLKPAQCILQIGDYVIVSPNAKRTLVLPGTEGIIVGGDGKQYVVSFTMRRFPGEDNDLDRAFMVTQEGVPAESLILDDSKSIPFYEDYDESDDNDDGDSDSGSDGDDGEESDDEDHNNLSKLRTRPMPGTNIQSHHFIGMTTRIPYSTLNAFGKWTQENYDQVLDTQEDVGRALDIFLDEN